MVAPVQSDTLSDNDPTRKSPVGQGIATTSRLELEPCANHDRSRIGRRSSHSQLHCRGRPRHRGRIAGPGSGLWPRRRFANVTHSSQRGDEGCHDFSEPRRHPRAETNVDSPSRICRARPIHLRRVAVTSPTQRWRRFAHQSATSREAPQPGQHRLQCRPSLRRQEKF